MFFDILGKSCNTEYYFIDETDVTVSVVMIFNFFKAIKGVW